MLPEDVQPHFSSQTRTARNFYVSRLGRGGLGGKAAYGTADLYISREEKRMQAKEKNIDSGKTLNQHISAPS